MQKTELCWCKFFCQLASFTYWFNCSSNTSLSIWRPENRKWKILPKYQGIKCKFTFNQTFLPLLFLYALGLNSSKLHNSYKNFVTSLCLWVNYEDYWSNFTAGNSRTYEHKPADSLLFRSPRRCCLFVKYFVNSL